MFQERAPGLKVTTRRGVMVIASPVFGLRPLRLAFALTVNPAEAVILMLSPDASVTFMSSKTVLTTSVGIFFGHVGHGGDVVGISALVIIKGSFSLIRRSCEHTCTIASVC